MKHTCRLAICAFALACAACAPQPKYAWGSYESSLYDHYKTPGNSTAFAQHLADTIASAEAAGQRVPPGVYAEYGKVLLDAGDNKQASVYFEKEEKTWPESSVLMTNMMRLASAQGAKQ